MRRAVVYRLPLIKRERKRVLELFDVDIGMCSIDATLTKPSSIKDAENATLPLPTECGTQVYQEGLRTYSMHSYYLLSCVQAEQIPP